MEIKIVYKEVHISKVLKHYVKDLELKSNLKLIEYEHYFDPIRGSVILKLYIEEKESKK